MSNPFYSVRFNGIRDVLCLDHCPHVGDYITVTRDEMAEICGRKLVPFQPLAYKVVAVIHCSNRVCADRETMLILEPAVEELAAIKAKFREDEDRAAKL
jgi:hypothetical protein